LVHREETMSILGFPVFRYIDVNESEVVLRAIQRAGSTVPLDIVLHTPGGLVLASLQIARAIHKHDAKVTALVPHYAMSGGTLIALASDQSVMSEHAVVGLVDPQLGDYSAASALKAVSMKPAVELDDRTLVLADGGTWTHDHPITYETIRDFGLPVRCDIPAEFLELMSFVSTAHATSSDARISTRRTSVHAS
jgi:ClpP class serine protease